MLMKKFITLLLVLTGMVLNVSADTVKKRIYIQNSVNWSTKNMYMWKKGDDSVKPLGDWPGTGMSGYNSGYEKWYFIDVVLEESTDYYFIFNDGSNQSTNIPFNSSTNKFYAVWGTGNSDYNVNDLTYYLYDTSDGSTTELTIDKDLKFSFSIDNTTSANKYYTIAPSFVTSWYGSDDKRWSMMIRPYADYQPMGFTNITSDQAFAGVFAGSGTSAWNCNAKAVYDIEVNLDGWTYSSSPYFTRTINSAESEGNYYATFSSIYNVAIPAGIEAYYAQTSQSTAGRISLTAFANGIYAGEGAFLKTTGSSVEYTFTPAASTDHSDTDSNLLKAGLSTGVPASTDGSYNYVFANTSGLGFYKVTSDIDVDMTGKAYLHSTSELSARLAFDFDGEDVTGINNVKNAASKNEAYYNLAGQRVARPTKGLYIVNGKKVIVK